VPAAILGEANYREFVKRYKPDGLIVGGEWCLYLPTCIIAHDLTAVKMRRMCDR
jgi:hypothetical protein